MNNVALEIHDLHKVYGSFAAVDGIGFNVNCGEIFGLLGPNGAGKTTTLECLEGIRQPSSGKLDILGVNPSREPGKLHNLLGVQLQTSSLPGDMLVEEAMRFFCAYHGVAPRYDLLDRLGLQEKRRTPYRQLSVGQQRRLALALAVAHKPPLVILDEPTAGLDVESRTELHALMRELRQSGTTILLATHDMAEAEKMTDRVAILLHGKIVAEGSPLELTATGSGMTKVSVRTDNGVLLKRSEAFPGVQKQLDAEEYAIFFSTDPGVTVTALLDYITAQNDKLIDLRIERPSLEERFLEITGQGGAQ